MSEHKTPLVVLRDDELLGHAALENRLRVGRGPDVDLALPSEEVPPRWGVLFSRGGRVYAQEEGGSLVELEPGDGLVIGPYVVARADPGTRLYRVVADREPGARLGFDPRHEPFRRVVLTSSLSHAQWMRRNAESGKTVGARRDATPAGGLSGGETRGVRTRSQDGQRYYAVEPHYSAAVDQAAAAAIRPLEGRAEDPGALERLGHELLDRMLAMEFPEVVALMRRMAKDYDENYLEHLYRRALNRSPMLAFRWALVIAERYVRAARVIGGRIELPDLSIGLDHLISSEAAEGFRRARTQGAKIASRGPW